MRDEIDVLREMLTSSELQRSRLVEALKKCEILMSGATKVAPMTDDFVLHVAREALASQPPNFVAAVLDEVEKRMSEGCVGSDEYGIALPKLKRLTKGSD